MSKNGALQEGKDFHQSFEYDLVIELPVHYNDWRIVSTYPDCGAFNLKRMGYFVQVYDYDVDSVTVSVAKSFGLIDPLDQVLLLGSLKDLESSCLSSKTASQAFWEMLFACVQRDLTPFNRVR